VWWCFPDPYVRVVQLNGSTGRSIKRKKTAFKHGTECPEFNETLTFDLTPNQLETTTFLVLLCSRTVSEESDGQMDRKSKDKCLGKVALGSHVLGKRQKDHWLSVIQNPRRVVSAWYTLKWTSEWQWNADTIVVASWHSWILCQLIKNINLGCHD
jgi:hypothetical protein